MDNSFISLENLRRFLENLRSNTSGVTDAHATDFNNPHKVTKLQIGLSNVDNTSDVDKPVSSAQKAYIDGQDASTLTSAKNYTDTAKASAISTAASDASAKANSVQTELNTHTANVTDAHNIANRLLALESMLKSYTDQSISQVVSGAPEILNTLNELSAAIVNNTNFSTTMLQLIGEKLNSS